MDQQWLREEIFRILDGEETEEIDDLKEIVQTQLTDVYGSELEFDDMVIDECIREYDALKKSKKQSQSKFDEELFSQNDANVSDEDEEMQNSTEINEKLWTDAIVKLVETVDKQNTSLKQIRNALASQFPKAEIPKAFVRNKLIEILSAASPEKKSHRKIKKSKKSSKQSKSEKKRRFKKKNVNNSDDDDSIASTVEKKTKKKQTNVKKRKSSLSNSDSDVDFSDTMSDTNEIPYRGDITDTLVKSSNLTTCKNALKSLGLRVDAFDFQNVNMDLVNEGFAILGDIVEIYKSNDGFLGTQEFKTHVAKLEKLIPIASDDDIGNALEIVAKRIQLLLRLCDVSKCFAISQRTNTSKNLLPKYLKQYSILGKIEENVFEDQNHCLDEKWMFSIDLGAKAVENQNARKQFQDLGTKEWGYAVVDATSLVPTLRYGFRRFPERVQQMSLGIGLEFFDSVDAARSFYCRKWNPDDSNTLYVFAVKLYLGSVLEVDKPEYMYSRAPENYHTLKVTSEGYSRINVFDEAQIELAGVARLV